MRKGLFFSICFFIQFLIAHPFDLHLDSQSAILIDAETGKVLFEKNAHLPSYPASLTKISTALFVLENAASLDIKVTASDDALKIVDRKTIEDSPYILEKDGALIGLKEEEKISIKNLLYSLLIASGNDAANVIAESVSGSVPLFMEDLNEYLRSIGCMNTVFLNPHGLHHNDHKTTAYDLSIIARRAMKDPLFRKIVSSECYFLSKTNMHPEKKLINTNKLICKEEDTYYPYAFGIKTGYTSIAGYNLASIAKKNGRSLIAIVIGGRSQKSRYQDVKALFEAAFSEQKKKRTLIKKDRVFSCDIDGAKDLIKCSLEEEVVLEYYPSECKALRAIARYDDLKLPISKGQKVGQIEVLDEVKNVLLIKNLYAQESVKSTFFASIKAFFGLQ